LGKKKLSKIGFGFQICNIFNLQSVYHKGGK